MKFKVEVAANENGEIVQQNPNKPDYGSIALEQRRFSIKNNYLSEKVLKSWLQGTLGDLKRFVEVHELGDRSIIPGTLYTIEQFVPFYESQNPKANPTTGEASLVDGALVYQQTFYDESGTRFDSFIMGETSKGDKIMEPRANYSAKASDVPFSSVDSLLDYFKTNS